MVFKEKNVPFSGIIAILLAISLNFMIFWYSNFIRGEVIDYNRAIILFFIIFSFTILLALIVYIITFCRSFGNSLFVSATLISLLLWANCFPKMILETTLSVKFYSFLCVCIVSSILTYFLAKLRTFRRLYISTLSILILGNFFILTVKYFNHPLIHYRNKRSKISMKHIKKSMPFINQNIIPKYRPNVYFIILDAHVGNRAFKKFYKSDYSDLNNFLESKGFFVAQNSHSNYPITGLSILSTLSMVYSTDYNNYIDIRGLCGDSFVQQAFRNRGYKIVQTSNGYAPVTGCGGYEDICIAVPWYYPTSQEQAFFSSSSIVPWFKEIILGYRGYLKDNPVYGIKSEFLKNKYFEKFFTSKWIQMLIDSNVIAHYSFQISDVPKNIPSKKHWPFFWFIHTMGMHNVTRNESGEYQYSPEIFKDCVYQYDKKLDKLICEAIPPFKRLPRENNDSFGTRVRYVKQQKWLANEVKQAVNKIIKIDPEAVIIIQADHGTTEMNGKVREKHTKDWTRDDVLELYNIFNAIRLPKKEWQERLYDSISSVNTFRLILGCLDKKDYPFLPDRMIAAAYVGWWPDSPKYVEIDESFHTIWNDRNS